MEFATGCLAVRRRGGQCGAAGGAGVAVALNAADRNTHRPVLLEASLQALNIRPDGFYVDGTFGRGGHAAAILAKLGPKGLLLAFDKDPDAVASAREKFEGDARFRIVHGSFTMLKQVVQSENSLGRVDGVLLDLGVSSPQLDDAGRGFSFQQEGPLDMRMNPEAGQSAADWLNSAPEKEISEVIRDFGEEKFHRRIAAAVVKYRAEQALRTTREFAELVAEAVPVGEKGKHPATRTFQAVRIHINKELDDLDAVLEQALDVLAPGGRLAVISFHSLEDRRVKRFMREHSRPKPVPRGLPAPMETPPLKLIGKAIRADLDEIDVNPRARSAVLRVAERAA